MTPSRSKPSAGVVVWWLSLGLIALVVGAVVWGLDNEQHDLATRGAGALAGLSVTVEIDGRDATLVGTAASYSEIDRAERAILNLRGVRTVSVTALVVNTVLESPASFSIEHDETQTLVRGVVVDVGTARALVASVAAQFGSADIVDEIVIDATASSPEWLGQLTALILDLDGWRSGVFHISDDGASIIGIVDSEADAERITAELATGTRLDVQYDLDVITNRTPWFEASAADDAVSLAGELSSQDAIDATLAAAEATYASVDSRLDVAPVSEAPWMQLLPDVVERLGTWTSWRLRIEGGAGTLVAFAPSSAELSQTRSVLLDHLGIVWEGISLEVEAFALGAELTATVSGRITFETASAVLNEESLHVLDGVAATLAENPSAILTIEGHTDSQGGETANLRLSQDRADAVVAYLVGIGVDGGRLTAIGYGESRPIAENGTTFGRATNRRIEFVAGGIDD